METNIIMNGSALEHLKELPDESIDMSMTSPPYWALRDYGTASWKGGEENCNHKTEHTSPKSTLDGGKTTQNISSFYKDVCGKCGAKRVDKQLGLEPTFDEYINKLCDIYDEVFRVLKKEGTCWVNLGDTYNAGRNGGHAGGTKGLDRPENAPKQSGINAEGIPAKSLTMIPFRFAIEMVNRGWILRNVIIWHKRNCMPSSVKDRFTVDFEYLFFFSKNKKYYFETQYEPLSNATIEDLNKRTKMRWGDGSKGSKHFDGKGVKDYDKKGRTRDEFSNVEKGRNKRTTWDIKDRQTPYSILEPEFRKEIIDFRNLPEHDNIRDYLTKWKNNKKITINEIEKHFGNQAGHHWFEKNGSYPSKDDWLKLKELLEFDDLFDEPMTTIFQKSGLKQNSENGRIKRTTWTINPKPFKEAHFAVYPEELCEIPIKAGCFEGGIVLDPFFGSGTTGLVALKQNKKFIGIELNPEYIEIAKKRLKPFLEQSTLNYAFGHNSEPKEDSQ
jgi:DNA modification methylase|tara:strand:- start:1950 stop:3446 length:1497 start_codon:yes stop_codon:yes gene_type:complete